MKIVTYDTKKRKRVCEFLLKGNTKTEAEIKFGIPRQTIHRWSKRYDGTRESLVDKPRKPKWHPKACTQSEIELVKKAWREYGCWGGDYVYGILFRERGFKRKQSTMYKILNKYGLNKKKSKISKRENKPYDTAKYPGQKLQMDVKYVPKGVVGRDDKGKKYYQYTIIDEATGIRYLEWYEKIGKINTCFFVTNAMKFYPFRLCEIQTDNGSEFVNEDVERVLKSRNIRHKRIKPATPRHNGKVERSHRVDGKYFYDGTFCETFEELKEQGKAWNEEYNNMYMKKFNWLSPNEVYKIYRQKPKKPIKKRNLRVELLKKAA